MKPLLLAVLLTATLHAQEYPTDRERDNRQLSPEQLQRKQDDAARQAQLAKTAGADPLNLARIAPPQFLPGCPAMRRDDTVNLKMLALTEWIASGDVAQIPWKVEISKPVLRTDQRNQIAYRITVESKNLGWKTGAHELVFVSGVSSPDGKWLVEPKPGRQAFRTVPNGEFRVSFGDCLHLRPGDYIVWMALYDPGSAKHSLVKRPIRVSEVEDDPLPTLNSTLPAARFPEPNTKDPSLYPPLAVMNKQPLAVDLLAVASPADQWATRTDILNWTNSEVLAAMSVLSQMKLAQGSLSAFSLDLVGRATRFEQRDLVQLDRQGLSDSFYKPKDLFKTDIEALEAFKSRSAFFRKVLTDRLNGSGGSQRAVIIVSGSLLFARGSDLTAAAVEGDCRCRVYHLRFRVNKDDVFDHTEKLIKPYHPQTFDVSTAVDVRKAIAKIVRDLETF